MDWRKYAQLPYIAICHDLVVDTRHGQKGIKLININNIPLSSIETSLHPDIWNKCRGCLDGYK